MILLILGFCASAFANINPVVPKTNQFHLGWTTEYYRSEENFSGAINGTYQEVQNSLLADYDLSSRVRLKSELNIPYAMAESATYDNSNAYLNFLKIGGESWFVLHSVPLIAYGNILIPFYKPNLVSSDTSASEGVYEFEGGVAARARLGPVRGHLQAGLLYLLEGRGGRIPWKLGASYGFVTGRMEGGVRGVQTVVKDSASTKDLLQRAVYTTAAQAGSLKYLSQDPSYQEVYLNGRFGLIHNLDFSVEGAYAVAGVNYSKGFSIMGGLHWLIPGSGAGGGISDTPPPLDTFEAD